MKKLVSFALSVAMLLCAATGTAFAADNTPQYDASNTVVYSDEAVPMPRFTYIASLSSSLAFSKVLGWAECDGSVTIYDNLKVTLILDLQEATSGGWKTIDTWSKDFSGAGAHTISKSKPVSKGSYRVLTTAKIKNSSGAVLEQFTGTSPIRTK